MNGALLVQIKYISEISIRQNACIDRTFTEKDEKQAMRQLVTSRCGFSEPKNRKNQVSCLVKTFPRSKMVDSCIFGDPTVIDSRDFLISNSYDNGVLDLFIRPSTAVHFLSIFVNFKFPNLKYYRANNCNITEISKMNFANLSQIVAISLAGNKIETILKNTFEGLVLLEKIYLSEFGKPVLYCKPQSFLHFRRQ